MKMPVIYLLSSIWTNC